MVQDENQFSGFAAKTIGLSILRDMFVETLRDHVTSGIKRYTPDV